MSQTKTPTDTDYFRLGPIMVREILDRLDELGSTDKLCTQIADEFEVPGRLVKQIKRAGSHAVAYARTASHARALANGRGNQSDFVRLGPRRVQEILDVVVALEREAGREERETPRQVADEFQVPLRLVLQILAHGADAVKMAEKVTLRETFAEPIEEPTPSAETLPMDKQREIVARYIRGVSIADLAFDMGFSERAVKNVLVDAGYAVSVVQEAHRREGLSR